MCGIVGYTGTRNAQEILLDCLKRLEYRGYDSAGIAIVSDNDEIAMNKSVGEISVLEASLEKMKGKTGIAHTRWATHGKPTTNNAHPFLDCKGEIAIVHNGIITNYLGLKRDLEEKNHEFTSETDSEILAHLFEDVDGDLLQKMISALKEVQGSFAVAAINHGRREIVAARNESPLVIGVGHDENFVSSDVTALLKHTNEVIYVQDGEIVRITPDSIELFDNEGRAISRGPQKISWSLEDAERSGYTHFMLKEIFEQPQAIHESMLGRLEELEEDSFFSDNRFSGVKIIGCGTSYHAGLVGKYIIEELSKLPTTVQISSEYRYSPVSEEKPLIVCITQSGETADTLAAAREARRRGCKLVAITNVLGSAITREVDSVIYTRAGPEIGVAATKTFVTQLVALYLLGLRLAISMNTISSEGRRKIMFNMRSLSRSVQSILNRAKDIEELAKKFDYASSMFFIGRHINFPTSLEGALKTKEISYIHGEGYPAGELKHGPLALLSKNTPVIAICVRDHTYEKMLGNIREVSAREAPVLAVGTEGEKELMKFADDVFLVPHSDPLFTPIPIIVVLQLFAYYLARERKCPIDKPRNIAKTVTVE